MQINGHLVVGRRRRLALTQRALATRAGVSRGTVKAAEHGTAGLRSIRKLARVLGLTIIEMVGGPEQVPPDRDPLFVYQQNTEDDPHIVVPVTYEATQLDMKGDFDGSRLRFERALAKSPVGSEARAHLLIGRAVALDNAGRTSEALAVLRSLLDGRGGRLAPRTQLRAMYHVGLAHRRIAESGHRSSAYHLDKARRHLTQVAHSAEGLRTAAFHQLGCVHLVEARVARWRRPRGAALRRAVRFFDRSKRQWKRAGNYREGYSLRRLAEVAALEGRVRSSHAYLLDALEVFARFGCDRYRDEVRSELDRLAADLPDGRVAACGSDHPS